MKYHDHHEWAGWLASIREQPDDDNRRLFCADWLDELETEEARQRAELIRVQVELSKTMPEPHHCTACFNDRYGGLIDPPANPRCRWHELRRREMVLIEIISSTFMGVSK